MFNHENFFLLFGTFIVKFQETTVDLELLQLLCVFLLLFPQHCYCSQCCVQQVQS